MKTDHNQSHETFEANNQISPFKTNLNAVFGFTVIIIITLHARIFENMRGQQFTSKTQTHLD